MAPVSYTHLDVYKRQESLLHFCEPGIEFVDCLLFQRRMSHSMQDDGRAEGNRQNNSRNLKQNKLS